jgi:hypothetical protein
MRLLNHVPARISSVVAFLVLGPLLAACATVPVSRSTRILTATANPVGVQTGRLTVVALDGSDSGALFKAAVEIVAADQSLRDPHYYRRLDITDRNGTVTFTDVPLLVNVSITHARGTFALENYFVKAVGPSELRVLIDTTGARAPEECLSYTLCGR